MASYDTDRQTHDYNPDTSGLPRQYNREVASGGIDRESHRLSTSGADDIGCGIGGRYDYRLCRTTDITDYHQHLRLRWCE
jgi:hypothetical protein